MEPLMSLDGYRVIENDVESRELLNKFYEQKGMMTASLHDTTKREFTVSGSTNKQTR